MYCWQWIFSGGILYMCVVARGNWLHSTYWGKCYKDGQSLSYSKNIYVSTNSHTIFLNKWPSIVQTWNFSALMMNRLLMIVLQCMQETFELLGLGLILFVWKRYIENLWYPYWSHMYAWVYIVAIVVIGFLFYIFARACSFFTHNQRTFISKFDIGF